MAVGVGVRPAEVWGWLRKPFFSRMTISFLRVAGDTPSLYFFSRVTLPTGLAVSVNSSTAALIMAICLSVRSISNILPRVIISCQWSVLLIQ